MKTRASIKYLVIFFMGMSHAAQASKTAYLFYISSDHVELWGDGQFFSHIQNIFSSANPPGDALVLFDSPDPDQTVQFHGWVSGKQASPESTEDFLASFATHNANDTGCVKGGLPPVDMDCEAVFSRFLKDFRLMEQAQTTPYDRVILVMVGHGLGWLGFGFDSQYDPKSKKSRRANGLSLGAMKRALQLLKVERGRPLDAIIFNACLMGGIELAYELRETVNWFSAPTLKIPIAGSDYERVRKRLEERGAGAVEIFKELTTVYNYLPYHFSFERAGQWSGLSLKKHIEAIQNTRIVTTLLAKEEKSTFATRPGEAAFSLLESSLGQFLSDNGTVLRVAAENNLTVETAAIAGLRDAWLESVSIPLERMFTEKGSRYLTIDRLYGSDLPTLVGSGLPLVPVDSMIERLAHLTEIEPWAGDPKKMRTLALKIRSLYTGFAASHVAGYSVFFPDSELFERASLSRIASTERSDCDRLMDGVRALDFYKDFGWDRVVQSFQDGLAIKSKTRNLPETEFGRYDVEE